MTENKLMIVLTIPTGFDCDRYWFFICFANLYILEYYTYFPIEWVESSLRFSNLGDF